MIWQHASKVHSSMRETGDDYKCGSLVSQIEKATSRKEWLKQRVQKISEQEPAGGKSKGTKVLTKKGEGSMGGRG